MIDHPLEHVKSPSMSFVDAVTLTSAILHAKLPEAMHSRLEMATALVLNGAVSHEEDDEAFAVRSTEDPTHFWLVNGSCSCPDATYRAPGGICKHRIAVGLYRKALARQTRPLEAPPALIADVAPCDPPALPPTFREAPASVNCYIQVEGREALLTLRDTDEQHLLQRLARVLTAYPATPRR